VISLSVVRRGFPRVPVWKSHHLGARRGDEKGVGSEVKTTVIDGSGNAENSPSEKEATPVRAPRAT